MPVFADVTLRDTRSGAVTVYLDKRLYPDFRAAAAAWISGDCGCDCNRSLALWKAAHPGVAAPDAVILPCNHDTPFVVDLLGITVHEVSE